MAAEGVLELLLGPGGHAHDYSSSTQEESARHLSTRVYNAGFTWESRFGRIGRHIRRRCPYEYLRDAIWGASWTWRAEYERISEEHDRLPPDEREAGDALMHGWHGTWEELLAAVRVL